MKMNRKIKKALILGAVCGAVLGMALTFAAASKALDKKEDTMAKTHEKLKAENKDLQSKLKQQKSVEAAAVLSKQEPENWELVLVNDDYPLDQEYQPELAEITEGRSVDSRILERYEADAGGCPGGRT